MDRKVTRKLAVSFSITGALALLFLFLSQHKTFQILELKSLDLRFSLKSHTRVNSPVVHIDIDDQSLAQVGRWPWPRKFHATLIEVLKECQASELLMDVLFMEKFTENPEQDASFASKMRQWQKVYLPFYFLEEESTISPRLNELLGKDIHISIAEAAKAMGVTTQSLKEKLPSAKRYLLAEVARKLLQENPGLSFDELIEKVETTSGWNLFTEDESYIREYYENQQSCGYFIDKFSKGLPQGGWPFKKSYNAIAVPIREYIDAMKGSGFINAMSDLDGVTRRVPLFMRYENRILPQLTVSALIDFLQVQKIEARPNAIIFKGALLEGKTKDIIIPVDENGAMLINWQGRWGDAFKHVPYYLILKLQETREQLKAELAASDSGGGVRKGMAEYLAKSERELRENLSRIVKDKICIVGLTATGTHDLRPIPLQENYPMVGTHSNLINTIFTESFLQRKGGVVSWCIYLLTALIIALSSLVKLWKSMLLAACFAIGYFLCSFFLFAKLGIWIDLVGPLGVTIFGFSSITSFRYFTEEKEKTWIKQAFSHYLSKEVINELLDNPSKLKLGGERKNITVFFSDVRGFTTFSESHQPEEVVGMLNELLSEQVKVVFKYSGTLDKFVGDELMAFYGAPGERHKNDHALVAVKTAIEIQDKLKEFKAQWEKEKKDVLHIGIGINTGDMVVGNMGSLERMDYTVIGDNVNLAARLCSAAKADEILISEATYLGSKEEIEVEKLEPIMVKGKSQPIPIYRVVGLKTVPRQ